MNLPVNATELTKEFFLMTVPVDYGFGAKMTEGSGDYDDYDLGEGSGLKAGLEESDALLKDLAVTAAVEKTVKGDDPDEAILHLIAATVGAFVGLVLAALVITCYISVPTCLGNVVRCCRPRAKPSNPVNLLEYGWLEEDPTGAILVAKAGLKSVGGPGGGVLAVAGSVGGESTAPGDQSGRGTRQATLV